MTKNEAIEYMSERGYPPDKGSRVTYRKVDHAGNPLAPEIACYKVSIQTCGIRSKFSIWPNTVGFQGYK